MEAKGDLTGFEVLGPDGNWTSAQATTSGPDTVEVSAPSVPHPKGVRYAWAPSPAATLFNKEGLPASPFTSNIPNFNNPP